jgi:hypothetical protein
MVLSPRPLTQPPPAPGATHRVHLDFTIAQGADTVARAAARIEKLQATHPPTIEPKPLQAE